MHLISVDLKEKIDLEESFRRKLKMEILMEMN